MKEQKRLPDALAVYGALALLLALGICAFLFPGDFSVWERRFLSPPPSNFSPVDWTLQGDLEAYLSDQIPFRRALVNLHASYEAATGRASQLDAWPQLDGSGRLHFIEKPVAGDQESVRRRLDALCSLAGDLPHYFLTPPTAGSLLESAMAGPRKALFAQDEALYQWMAQREDVIDLSAAFRLAPDAGCYFRTDHHWNLDGAWQAYLRFCEERGLPPVEKDAFSWTEAQEAPSFLGTTYSRSGLPFASADSLRAAEPRFPVSLTISDDGAAYDHLIFPEEAETYDGYAIFLKGNHGVLEIDNPAAPEGTLFVCKDSFANCLLSFLSAHYSRIIAVDARYCEGTLNDVLAASGKVDEMLFVYSLDSLATDTSILRKIKR